MSVVYNRKMNGKLMLTGEYFVLEGATSLALPTIFGQYLTVEEGLADDFLTWKSMDRDGNVWLDLIFRSEYKDFETTNEGEIIEKIFRFCEKLNPKKLDRNYSYFFNIKCDFDRAWGLGSSSTLIALIADFFKVNPYQLLAHTFKGSGYDIACANSDSAVLYTLDITNIPIVEKIKLSFPFQENIYFAYLGKKQNSRDAMKYFDEVKSNGAMPEIIEKLNQITADIQLCSTLEEFEMLLNLHEDIIHNALHLPKVKDLYFSDWEGSVKSLGAWGGDFVLITNRGDRTELIKYLKSKNMDTVFQYSEIIK